ncbi:MAG TPA: hypothetical protein VKD90_04915 [Gemmataceae bacterium]|nr:hypothetical protein [Gemmataceae bacterium]
MDNWYGSSSFKADGAAFLWLGVGIHAATLLLAVGAVGALFSVLRARASRPRLFLAAWPLAAVLGGLVQFWVTAEAPALNVPGPSSGNYRAIFFGVPYGLHVAALAIALCRYARRPPPADLAADYADPDPRRPGDAAPPT